MFQKFDVTARPEQGPPRLKALREKLETQGLVGFLVPRADVHQGEYVPARDARLAWLTGFTGSAGLAAVLKDRAALFVDGRYTVQGRAQVAEEIEVVQRPPASLSEWLAEAAPNGSLGFDPWLHTVREINALSAELKATRLKLTAVDNLVDSIWANQPAPPQGAADVHPDALAGRSHGDKRQQIAQILRDAGQRTALLTLPDSVNWLLNIRGHDLPNTPFALGFALIHDDARMDLFMDPAKTAPLEAHFGSEITCHPMEALAPALARAAGPIRLDPASAPQATQDILTEAGVDIARDADPCILPKARKTPAELQGARDAHLRDGAAMVRFLHWLDNADPAQTTEIDAAKRLEAFRADTGALRDLSFDSISAAGPHAALPHYRVTTESNAPLSDGALFLIDSGGQYQDGTTDITRTIAVGTPNADQRAAYTAVLMGMIDLSLARFPNGYAGRDLDAVARAALWRQGRDYDHGTGHGVGSYLSVHEGPQRIARISEVPLDPGMILSNEPGYYREGAYGIRIENLLAVRVAEGGADARDWLDFETLTFVPIDLRPVEQSLLAPHHRDWIDRYHAEVLAKIGPLVDGGARDWLDQACAALPDD